jgi:hypothetical protein
MSPVSRCIEYSVILGWLLWHGKPDVGYSRFREGCCDIQLEVVMDYECYC